MRHASLRHVPGIMLLATACGTDAGAGDDSVAATATFIDSTIAPAVAGTDGWNYSERATADVMGDSAMEQIVLTARVEMDRGRPAWDDGQPWQVYLETTAGERHYLYAQRLQLGTLTLRVTQPDSGTHATILLIEHLPDRLRVLESDFSRSPPGLVLRLERALDPRGQQAAPRLP